MSLRAERDAQLAALEERLHKVTWRALRAWLAIVGPAALLPGITAAPGREVPPDPQAANAARPEWERLVREHIVTEIGELLGELFAETLGADGVVSARSWQEQYLSEIPNRVVGLPDEVFAQLTDELQGGIDAGQSIPAIRDRMAGVLSLQADKDNRWYTRAASIARTEATSALNGGQTAAWAFRNQVTGRVTEKFWIASMDSRTRDDHYRADGQRVPLDGEFLIGGHRMAHPGDPKAPVEQRVQCRCSVGEVDVDEDLPDVDDRHLGSGRAAREINRRAHAGEVRDRDNPDQTALIAAPTPQTAGRTSPGQHQNAVTAAGGDIVTARTWQGVLAPIGVNSGDRRRFKTGGSFQFRQLPLPLMFQETTAEGHDTATVVGRILTIDVRGDQFWGTGDYLEGPEFAATVNKAIALAESEMGHVSVDLADVVSEVTDANGSAIPEDVMWAMMESGDVAAPKLYEQFAEATIIGATQVAKPAFGEARITVDPITALAPAGVPEILGGAPAAGGEPSGDSGEGAAIGDVVAADLGEAAVDEEGTTLAVGDIVSFERVPAEGGAAETVSGAVTAIDEEAGTVTVQPVGEAATPITVPAGHVRKLTPDAPATPPAAPADSDPAPGEGAAIAEPTAPSGVTITVSPAQAAAAAVAEAEAVLRRGLAQIASLQAAAGPAPVDLDWAPDAELFADPQLAGPTPMTIGPVEADGTRRVFGHIAAWGQCHVGFSKCVTPPDEDSFDYFHIGAVVLADGAELAVGKLTLGGRHADVKLAYRDAIAHYDDNGAGVAMVRAYKDAHGIAVAGVIAPWTSPGQLVQMRSCGLSGDWRRIGTRMRLSGALAVNTGGFPMPRHAVDGRGRQLGLVAAGMVPQSLATEESYEDVARRVFADERAKERRRDEIAAMSLTASAAANQVALASLLASAMTDHRAELASLMAAAGVN